jgi:hypothetical protein
MRGACRCAAWRCAPDDEHREEKPVNTAPAMVAISFVNRLTIAHAAAENAIPNRPNGISFRRHEYSTAPSTGGASGRLNRRMSTEMALKAKLQMTPKAYASPRTNTSPRLRRIVAIWRMTMRLIRR